MKHSILKSRLDDLKTKNQFRKTRTMQPEGHQISVSSKELINFSGNDYLGLAGDTEIQANFFEVYLEGNTQNWMASSSSRSLTGTFPSHKRLEENVAKSYGKERALIFNSGYHANSGILPAITTSEDLILTDKLIHASLIDGVRLGKAKYKRFLHNNMQHLESLLKENHQKYRTIWIVSESLFSMDGDYAPLAKLICLKEKYNAYLYIDEAHAVGCIGPNGLGLADELDVVADIDLLVGTFGKALAGYGGFAVGDNLLIETMENFSRSWIFSTSLPPITIDWNNFIWENLEQFSAHRDQLSHSTKLFREGLKKMKLESLGESHIVPLITPGNSSVVEFGARLENVGVLALPIRSPTVAKGQERIRFSLTAGIPAQQIEKCLVEIQRTR